MKTHWPKYLLVCTLWMFALSTRDVVAASHSDEPAVTEIGESASGGILVVNRSDPRSARRASLLAHSLPGPVGRVSVSLGRRRTLKRRELLRLRDAVAAEFLENRERELILFTFDVPLRFGSEPISQALAKELSSAFSRSGVQCTSPSRLRVECDKSVAQKGLTSSAAASASQPAEMIEGDATSDPNPTPLPRVEAPPKTFSALQGAELNDPCDACLLGDPSCRSVHEFGATGDGISDDTAAIQRGIDELGSGEKLWFPSGVYLVHADIGSGVALQIRPDLTITGRGTIRMDSDQGNYRAILGPNPAGADVSDFELSCVTLDGNGEGNPVRDPSLDFGLASGGDNFRFALQIYSGRRIRVANAGFINQSNVQSIALNGAVGDVVIDSNGFYSIGGGEVDYDHSTVYVHVEERASRGTWAATIRNNVFRTRHGPGTNGAMTAIETHGPDVLVEGNDIDGFVNGMNVTGVAGAISENILVKDNAIARAHTGIFLWSNYYGELQNGVALSGAAVLNNDISLDVMGWPQWRDVPSAGIKLEPSSNAEISGLDIVNNRIIFEDLTDAGRASDDIAGGIVLWRAGSRAVPISHLVVSGNIIQRPPSSGIYLSNSGENVAITSNLIESAGQSLAPAADYRWGILLDGAREPAVVSGNTVRDLTGATEGGIRWFDFSLCGETCTAEGNEFELLPGRPEAVLE